MSEDLLSKFGEDFTVNVRDRVIGIYDKIVTGKMKSKEDLQLSEKLKKLNKEERDITREVVINCIDMVLHEMLDYMSDNEEVGIYFVDGMSLINASDISDGLAGELYSEDGWLEKYSKYKRDGSAD